jgi:hypothetical protein
LREAEVKDREKDALVEHFVCKIEGEKKSWKKEKKYERFL